jgi:hypothetical protein
MYYPATDAAMNTASYEQFATGYYLIRKAMEWFWDAYTTNPAQRAEITASPNQASVEQVAGLPPTYLCVDEADVLRDEGEAYAALSWRPRDNRALGRHHPRLHAAQCAQRDPRRASRLTTKPSPSCAQGSEPAEAPSRNRSTTMPATEDGARPDRRDGTPSASVTPPLAR